MKKRIHIYLMFMLVLFMVFPLFARPKSHTVTYLRSLTLNPDRTIILHGEILPDMIQNAINKLVDFEQQSLTAPIYIIIDSPGGYVESGWKFINALQATKSKTIGIVNGGAYSMAAIISLYVNKLYVMDSADIMFHEAAYCICGSESIASSRLKHTQKYLKNCIIK